MLGQRRLAGREAALLAVALRRRGVGARISLLFRIGLGGRATAPLAVFGGGAIVARTRARTRTDDNGDESSFSSLPRHCYSAIANSARSKMVSLSS